MKPVCAIALFLLTVTAGLLAGCTSGGGENTIYIAGAIETSAYIPEEVSVVFFSNDTGVKYDTTGRVTGFDNYSVVGGDYKVDVTGYTEYQVSIPEPFENIGGIIAWIDLNNNGIPDPAVENVKLPVKVINGDGCIIVGFDYDTSLMSFRVRYNRGGILESGYITILGYNGYNFYFD